MSASPSVAVIDYGLGNLLSVRRALEHCGATPVVTAEPEAILAASHVILPGVGAFRTGMHALTHRGFVSVLERVVQAGTPLLGICLGMQLLFDESDEFELTKGLGIFPGRVAAIPSRTTDDEPQKIPHIGWSAIVPGVRSTEWEQTFLADVVPRSAAYFVHSYAAQPTRAEDTIAECRYGGWSICAAVARDNVMGAQFHPEKSGPVGLRALARFLQT